MEDDVLRTTATSTPLVPLPLQRTQSPQLPILPTEILCVIIAHLDPLALIDLSQTSSLFRDIIKPTHNDFVQRLLSLELLPAFGGIVPRFRARDNELSPPWDSGEWAMNKYACCVCLRLRSHMCFDNHSILRLDMRKPPPGSREATKLTDWEPLELRDPATRWKRRHQRAAQLEMELRPEKDTYRRYCTGADRPPGLLRDEPEPLDRRAEEAEMVLCGINRHTRACNNCRRLRGDWARPNQNSGSPLVPIIKSRQVRFTSAFERNFTGFIDYLQGLHPDQDVAYPAVFPWPRIFRVWNDNLHDEPWTLYAAWCSACGEWYELAGFRHYHRFPKQTPPDMRTQPNGEPPPESTPWPALCNSCLHAVSPSRFASQVSQNACTMAESWLRSVTYRMKFGWDVLYRDFHCGRLQGFKEAKDFLISPLPWTCGGHSLPTSFDGGRINQVELQLDESIFPLLRSHIMEVRQFLDQELSQSLRNTLVSSWFKVWLEDYELNEALYLRIKRLILLIKEDSGVFWDYIRAKDPCRIPS